MDALALPPLVSLSPHETPGAPETFADVVRDWLATKSGSFSSHHATIPYTTAHKTFMQWAERQGRRYESAGRWGVEDRFERALDAFGFRSGCVTFRGEPFWILALPSSVDGALDRLAERESRSA